MVKENKDIFNDLLMYRKIGFGKTSYVDYRFIIDKEYNVRVEMMLDREETSRKGSTKKISLSDEEKEFVDKFISKFIKPKGEKIPLFGTETDEYEKREIYYDNLIIEDDNEINHNFVLLKDYIESEHEELSSSNITDLYESINADFNNRKVVK